MLNEGQEQSAPDAARVAVALARIRAGVRQRQALLATPPKETHQLPASLMQVQAAQDLIHPLPVSHRRWIGPLMIFAKKAVHRVFMRWYLRPIVQQQNVFNRAVAGALYDLFERQRALERALAEDPGTPADGADLPAQES